DAPATRWRHTDDVVAPVGAAHRDSLLRLVARQVLRGDDPAPALHLRDNELRGLARVETVASLRGDALQRIREVGQAQRVALAVRRPVLRVLGDGRGIFLEARQLARK